MAQRRPSGGTFGGRSSLPQGGSPAPGWFVRDENHSSHSSRASSPGPGPGPGPGPDKGNIRLTIQNLADEQEMVQKKTFTNWINSYLVQRDPAVKIEDLFEDIKDGTKLLCLLEVLTGHKLPIERGLRLRRVHFISNVTIALQFLEERRIKLVNINASDVVDGKPAIVLGLIWTIILFFQIEELTKAIGQQAAQGTPMGSSGSLDNVPSSAKKLKPASKVIIKGGAKKTMLTWAQKSVSKKYGIQVKDFGQSWRDGHAFNAMIHTIRPELVDMTSLASNTNAVNLENAFSKAEAHLGIPRLIDPVDVDVDKPDEKSIMTYVAKFLEKYPVGDERGKEMPVEGERGEYDQLMQWLDQADETLTIVDRPVHDLQQEYQQYLTFQNELRKKHELYTRLQQKADKKALESISEDSWLHLRKRWTSTEQQTRVWQWKLDSNLPDRLGHLGDWLYRAEELLEGDIGYTEKHEETADNIHRKLEEHKVFFTDLHSCKREFQHLKKAAIFKSATLPRIQLDTMEQRFHQLTTRSEVVQRRLEYEELKFRLLAFLVATEAKLKMWTVKYGHQGDVESLMADYTEFVHTRELFKRYEETYIDCKRQADIYKRQQPQDKKESMAVNQSLDEITERWKKLTVEVTSVQTMLEEVVTYWRRYMACVDILTVWLADAQKMLETPPQERGDFFNDLDQYEEKHKVLVESSNFLIEVVTETVATEIKEQVLMLNQRWGEVSTSARRFVQEVTVEKCRQGYDARVSGVTQWLDMAEGSLHTPVMCTYVELRDRVQVLEKLLEELDRVQEEFKEASELARSLVKDSSQDKVKVMLNELKQIKERLMLVHKLIPETLKPMRSVLPQVESLENGVSDLMEWIREGNTLLASHKIDGNINTVEDRLENHQTHFKKVTYYKAMLESKNKVYQKIAKSKSQCMQTQQLHATMAQLNKQFQMCNANSKEWEVRLEKGLRMWRHLQSKAQPIEEWVTAAEAVLTRDGENTDDLLTNHKVFFERVDERPLEDFVSAANQLAESLDDTDRDELLLNVGTLQKRWKELVEQAPVHQCKLEFRGPEQEFLHNLGVAGETLTQQQQQLLHKADLKDLLNKHMVIFDNSGLRLVCETCLDQMKVAGVSLLSLCSTDHSLEQLYLLHLEQWRQLEQRVEQLRVQLEELPEQWRQYSQRLETFTTWMDSVDDSVKELERDTMSSQEYKDTIEKFQAIVKNIDEHRDAAKWLVTTLDELVERTANCDSETEQERLDTVVARYKSLMPVIEITTSKSSLILRCINYKDTVQEKTAWLTEAQNSIQLDVPLDSVAAVRQHLQQQEGVLARLEKEKDDLQNALAEGHDLLRQSSAPEFLEQTVYDLEARLKDTERLTVEKQKMLTEALGKWEEYETIKARLSDSVGRVDTESAQLTPGGHDIVQKDLETKQELIAELKQLLPALERLQSLTGSVCQLASEPRQESLNHDLTTLQSHVAALESRLTDQVSSLEKADQKWQTYTEKLGEFSEALSEKLTTLDNLRESGHTPEEQFRLAKGVCSDLYDSSVALEELEGLNQVLTEGVSAQDSTAMQCEVVKLRTQWNSLCDRAKSESQSLSTDVTHWNLYQNQLQQLSPWLQNARVRLEEEVIPCSSLEEAQLQLRQHEEFLREKAENQALYDGIHSEACHLEDKPDIASEVKRTDELWAEIGETTEERGQLLGDVTETWTQYSDSSTEVHELIKRLEVKVQQQLNIHAIDIATLQAEVNNCKALQQELTKKQPVVQKFSTSIDQLQPYLGPVELSNITTEQANVMSTWETITTTAKQQSQQLSDVLQQRTAFWEGWTQFVDWLTGAEERLAKTDEIYSDEVDEASDKLQAIDAECKAMEPDFSAISQQVSELCRQCESTKEHHLLEEQFNEVSSRYGTLQGLVGKRTQVCQQWTECATVKKSGQSEIKRLQQMLKSEELSEAEIAVTNERMCKIEGVLTEWDTNRKDLDELMVSSQMTIKDRATMKVLTFEAEIQTLRSEFARTSSQVELKQTKLAEVSKLATEFDQLHRDLKDSLTRIMTNVDDLHISESSLDGIREWGCEIEALDERRQQEVPKYGRVRDLGKQLMTADSARRMDTEAAITNLAKQWEVTEQLLSQRIDTVAAVTSIWRDLDDTTNDVKQMLCHVQEVISNADRVFDNREEVKVTLTNCKTTELELQGKQRLYDDLSDQSSLLLQESASVPNFNATAITDQVHGLQQRWLDSAKKLCEGCGRLQEELVIWETVDSGTEEVTTWLDITLHKLDKSLAHFGDSLKVEDCLDKYKSELAHAEEVFDTVCQKVSALQQLHKNADIPALSEVQSQLNFRFAQATELADLLQGRLEEFKVERDAIESDIDDAVSWVGGVRERLVTLDDASGQDEAIVSRLQVTKSLKDELHGYENKMAELEGKLQTIAEKYNSPETAALAKDLAVLRKKLHSAEQKSAEVEECLQGALEQHVGVVKQEQQQWLSTASEKVTWCADVSGDKYSIEAKMATITDLLSSMEHGQQITDRIVEKADLLKVALPEQKQTPLNVMKQNGQMEWQTFVAQLTDTKSKLEACMLQWQDYDTLYESFSNWVKDTEVKVRNEAGLQRDLKAKQSQAEQFEAIGADIDNHQEALQALMSRAEEICQQTNDSRISTHTRQLNTRYNALVTNVKDELKKIGVHVTDHKSYIALLREFSDWHQGAAQKLDATSDCHGEKEELEARLDTIQEMQREKHKGQHKFTATVEAGEHLYPSTSTEGREVIRQELCSLRDSWETYTDGLDDVQRKLDSALGQWSMYNDSCKKVVSWVKDMEGQLIGDLDLKNSRDEKKAVLQKCRTVYREIISHQSLVDEVSEKGGALESMAVSQSLAPNIHRYETLCATIKEHIKECELRSHNHQHYSDTYRQCSEWLHTLQERLQMCTEPAADKLSIQNQLERLKNLLPTMEEGVSRIEVVRNWADKTMPQTAPPGRKQIERECDSLRHDWDKFITQITSTKSSLEESLLSWQQFDKSFDALSKWLKETESQLTDYQVKSSLAEKKVQVEKFKALQQDIASKEPTFDDIVNKSDVLKEPKWMTTTAQLTSRYQDVKTTVKDLIGQWEGHVTEHEQYDANYNECSHWLNDLLRRLSRCSDASGDRHDIENLQAKLQELFVEKDEGALRIQHVVEQGEALYSSTAAEGREIVRQQLRSLREKWEVFTDQLSDTQRNVEVGLLQLSTFEDSVEQFHKWLTATEVKVRSDADPKATLQEKKMQLQSHKVQHQDVLSHQHVLDSLSDRAPTLGQTPKTTRQLNDLRQLYSAICQHSQELLASFERQVSEHQQYQDAMQECRETVDALTSRLQLCGDCTGDKFSVQNKLDRAKEIVTRASEVAPMVDHVKVLCDKTLPSTVASGKEVLKRQVNNLETDWKSLVSSADDITDGLQRALELWKQFDTTHNVLSEWMIAMERQLKELSLVSTLEEKEERVKKLKDLKTEVKTKERDFDELTDVAQTLLQMCVDSRINLCVTQITTRYTALQMTTKELLCKWESYVTGHEQYRSKYKEFTQWLTETKEQEDVIAAMLTDPDKLQHAREQLEALLVSKDTGLQKLTAAIEEGEKLYPDTAPPGRDKIRQQLRTAKDVWDSLLGDLAEISHRLDAQLDQWAAYSDSHEQLEKWLLEVDTWLDTDSSAKDTLPEKKAQLQNCKALLQDVLSHARMLESTLEKAQSLRHSGVGDQAALSMFISQSKEHYQSLIDRAKEAIARCETHVSDHMQYKDGHQGAVEWLRLMHDRLHMCSQATGDKHSVTNRAERVKDLVKLKTEGAAKLQTCENHAEATLANTGLIGRQTVQRELDELHQDWTQYETELAETEANLQTVLSMWINYETTFDQLAHRLKDMEGSVKEFGLVASLEEKNKQWKTYKDVECSSLSYSEALRELVVQENALLDTVQSYQRDVDEVSDQAQALTKVSSEARVTTYVSQLTDRYDTLTNSVKEIVKKCKQNVSDHEEFNERCASTTKWLDEARQKYDTYMTLKGGRDDIETKRAVIQTLVDDKETGSSLVAMATETGERLYPNTSADGRETVRQQLRRLKEAWDILYEDVMSSQRQLDVSELQWTSFKDSADQLESWLTGMEGQLSGYSSLHATLDEKKSQLRGCKSLCQDILSYQRVIDGVLDKAQPLAKNDPSIASAIGQINARYTKICAMAKERVSQYESYVNSHQAYQDAFHEFTDWLGMIKERLAMCSDVTGDRHAVQNRLDRLEDLVKTQTDGEPRMRTVLSLSEDLLTTTSIQGQEMVRRDMDSVQSDWHDLTASATQTKTELQKCLQQWKEFDDVYDHCATWLKQAEAQMRTSELFDTLADKQQQLQKLRSLNDDLTYAQADLDDMSDKAQALARTSGDTRVVSRASQLTSRYQTRSLSIKEQLRRWDAVVKEHQLYEETYSSCSEWLSELSPRLASCSSTDGDVYVLQSRLTKLQELLGCRDDGFQRIQQVVDAGHSVLPNTSSAGKDTVNAELQQLRETWDAIAAQMTGTKTALEASVSQWQLYDNTVEELTNWLVQTEATVKAEADLESTLPEKRAQLERMKSLSMNIESQKSLVNQLKDKADSSQLDQVSHLVNRFDTLHDKVKTRLRQCEVYVTDHQLYQDSCQELRDWLRAAQDNLIACADLRTDRHSLQAKKYKIQALVETQQAGEGRLRQVSERAGLTSVNTDTAGVDIIQAEVKCLADQLDTWTTSVRDTNAQLEHLCEQWSVYDDNYESLMQWLRDLETNVKRVTELRATLKDKQLLAEKYKEYFEEVRNKQTEFDNLTEKTQFLMHNSADSRVTTQLTQLNSRYSTLLAFVKDMLKKLIQHVDNHQQYVNAYQGCIMWFDTTNKRLASSADTSGDKDAIQARLDNLHDVVVLKEEGQSLIHIANMWGEKTMADTSAEGRDLIQHQLHDLQRDWDMFVSSVSDTRAALESCLVRWSSFDDSREQIQRWLKETERRLKEAQPKSDLTEKKALLQKMKGLYLDTAAYEHIVESVCAKAQELVLSSPACKVSSSSDLLVKRYNIIRGVARELVCRYEKETEEHQDYQDACSVFSAWLRTTREQFTTCCDIYGDKVTITAKLDRTRMLAKSLEEGASLLTKAKIAGKTIIPDTSESGQLRIQHDLDIMTSDLDEFSAQVSTVQDSMETCLTRWQQYEVVCLSFSDWLKETEGRLTRDVGLQPSLEEKVKLLKVTQTCHQEVLAHQSQLDEVNQCAQALLDTNTDARISHTITQLSTKYQTLVSKSKELLSRLEAYCSEHRSYDAAADDCALWLQKAGVKLDGLATPAETKEDVESQLTLVRARSVDLGSASATKMNLALRTQRSSSYEMRSSLEHGEAKLHSTDEHAKRMLANTSQAGCALTRDQLEDFHRGYEKLKSSLTNVKQELEVTFSRWTDFEQMFDELNVWIKDTEMRMTSDAELKTDISEKKAHLEKIKMLQKDIDAHEAQMQHLTDRSQQLQKSFVVDTAHDLRQRYETLRANIYRLTERLGSEVTAHEQYKGAYHEYLEWVTLTRHQLQQLSDTTGSQEQVKVKLDAFKTIKETFPEGESKFESVSEQCALVLQSTSPTGCNRIQQEMKLLKDELSSLHETAAEMISSLEANMVGLEEYHTEHAQFEQWLDEVEDKVKVNAQQFDLNAPEQLETDLEAVHEDIMGHRRKLEKLTERSEVILHKTSDTSVSQSIMQLAIRYQAVQAAAKDLSQAVDGFRLEERAYRSARESCQTWLRMTRERLDQSSGLSGSVEVTEAQLDSVKEIVCILDDGKHKLTSATDCAQKLLTNLTPEGKGQLEAEIAMLKSDWLNLNTDIDNSYSALEDRMAQWTTFNEVLEQLTRWLGEARQDILMATEPKVELMEKKVQIDKLKSLLKELGAHLEQVGALEPLVEELDGAEGMLQQTVTELRHDYDNTQSKIEDSMTKTQAAYDGQQAYRTALQECERWILQMSFQLMTHNSLDVSTRQLTEANIETHESLLTEIAANSTQLDQVRELGQQLIVTSGHLPQLVQQTESQLTNMDDSYKSLTSTATQIKERLGDVLTRWQQYEVLLDECDSYIRSEVNPWLEQSHEETTADSLDDTHLQQATAKDILDKLCGYRQDITTASHKCENASGLDSTDQSDGAATTKLGSRAAEVDGSLCEAVACVEARLSKVRENMVQWESMEKLKMKMEKWLGDKEAEVGKLRERPAKLHVEAAELEIAHLQELLTSIENREPAIEKISIGYTRLSPDGASVSAREVEPLRQRWESLVSQLSKHVESRRTLLDRLKSYHDQRQAVDQGLEGLQSDIQVIETADDVPLRDRINQLEKLQIQIGDKMTDLDQLKAMASDLSPVVGGRDQQLVQDHISTLERKMGQVAESCEKRKESFSVMIINYDDVLADVAEYMKWIRRKESELLAMPSGGSSVEQACSTLARHDDIMQEIEARQTLVSTVQHQGEALLRGVSSKESEELGQHFRQMQDAQRHLLELAEEKRHLLVKAVSDRQDLGRRLERVSKWLEDKKLPEASTKFPLNSQDTRKALETLKTMQTEVHDYHSSVERLLTDGATLLEDCPEDERPQLVEQFKEVETRYNLLTSQVDALVTQGQAILTNHKQFEADLQKIETWLKEAKTVCSHELLQDGTLDSLDAQVKKSQSLSSEARVQEALLKELVDTGNSFVSYLTDADQVQMMQQLEHTQDHLNRVSGQIEARLKAAEDIFNNKGRLDEVTTTLASTMQQSQDALRNLQQPVGPSLEDAQARMAAVQKLQDQLVDHQPKIAVVQQTMEQLTSLQQSHSVEPLRWHCQQYTEVMEQVALQAAKMAQAVLLREQYHGHKGELESCLKQLGEQMTAVNIAGVTMPTKLDRYKNALETLQSKEAYLSVIEDKAQQIGIESSTADKQILQEQVVAVRGKMIRLKTEAENNIEKLKKIIAERHDFENDLEQTNAWLKDIEVTQSHDHLDIDVESVDVSEGRLTEMRDEVAGRIERMRERLEEQTARYEDNDEVMHLELQDKVAEFKHLADAVKGKLEKEDEQLAVAKETRQQFRTTWQVISDWLEKAERRDITDLNVVAYETLDDQLQQHKALMAEEQAMQRQMDKLLDVAEVMTPTLDMNDRATLKESIRNLNEKLVAVTTEADHMKRTLESQATNWSLYQDKFSELVEYIDEARHQWQRADLFAPTSLAHAQQLLTQAQEKHRALSRDQALMTEVNTLAKQLQLTADRTSHDNIEASLVAVNQQWTELTDLANEQHSGLSEAIEKWEFYEKTSMSLGQQLDAAEAKLAPDQLEAVSSFELEHFLAETKTLTTAVEQCGSDLRSLQAAGHYVLAQMATGPSKAAVQRELLQFQDQFERLQWRAMDQQETIVAEQTVRDQVCSEVARTIAWLQQTKATQVLPPTIGVSADDVRRHLDKQKEAKQAVNEKLTAVQKTLTSHLERYFELPVEIRQTVIALKTAESATKDHMTDVEQRLNVAMETRLQYEALLQALHAWLGSAEAELEEQAADLPSRQRHLQPFINEIEEYHSKLERLQQYADNIATTAVPDDITTVKASVSDVWSRWQRLRSRVEQCRSEVNEAQELMLQFEDTAQGLSNQVERAHSAATMTITYTNLAEAQTQLTQARALTEEMTTNILRLDTLAGLAERLERIGVQSCGRTVCALREQLLTTQSETTGRLNALQQVVGEWCQLDQQVETLTAWLETVSETLEVKDTSMPLREQLTQRESLLTEIERHEQELTTVLIRQQQVLPASGLSSKGQRLSTKIGQLKQQAVSQQEQLKEAVVKVEKYKDEVTTLTRMIAQAQQQLQAAPVVESSVDGLQQQLAAHSVCMVVM